VPRAAGAAGTESGAGVPELEPPSSVAAISKTVEVVPFDDERLVLPGPWAPDGAALVAFVAVDDGGSPSPKVRVVVVPAPSPPDADALREARLSSGSSAASTAEGGDAETPSAVEAEGWVVAVGIDDESSGASLESAWDSRDVQDDLALAAGMAAWDASGNLVLARADGMRTDVVDDTTLETEELAGQPRQIVLGPDGRTVLAFGPEGAWVVDGSGRVRAIELPPGQSVGAASWRPDSAAVAMVTVDGTYYVADAATGSADEIASAPIAAGPDRVPAPRWLADGRVLLSGATWVGQGRVQTLDHRVVDPRDDSAETVAGILGLPASSAVPVDAQDWVSPDGSWLLYPEVIAAGAPNEYQHTATWLLATRRGEVLELPPLADPVWSPDGLHVAYRSGDGLAVWSVVEGARRVLLGDLAGAAAISDSVTGEATAARTAEAGRIGTVAAGEGAGDSGAGPDVAVDVTTGLGGDAIGAGRDRYGWSPDGRWLTYVDAAGGLWLVAADGGAGPDLLMAPIRSDIGPTWGPTSDRLAVTTYDAEGLPQLVSIRVGVADGGTSGGE
jgi:hypothetical protein